MSLLSLRTALATIAENQSTPIPGPYPTYPNVGQGSVDPGFTNPDVYAQFAMAQAICNEGSATTYPVQSYGGYTIPAGPNVPVNIEFTSSGWNAQVQLYPEGKMVETYSMSFTTAVNNGPYGSLYYSNGIGASLWAMSFFSIYSYISSVQAETCYLEGHSLSGGGLVTTTRLATHRLWAAVSVPSISGGLWVQGVGRWKA